MQVKLWTPSSGFCFVTFSEHTAPVTGVAFLPNSAAVVSCSLDGTVRAYDLIRYRNFRTMTSPTAQQFGCVAVDPSGEVVVAGSVDEFKLYVWAVKTARLLDVLAAHEGPVSALAFSPTQSLLASASWDKTVRTWDIFRCSPTHLRLSPSTHQLCPALRWSASLVLMQRARRLGGAAAQSRRAGSGVPT